MGDLVADTRGSFRLQPLVPGCHYPDSDSASRLSMLAPEATSACYPALYPRRLLSQIVIRAACKKTTALAVTRQCRKGSQIGLVHMSKNTFKADTSCVSSTSKSRIGIGTEHDDFRMILIYDAGRIYRIEFCTHKGVSWCSVMYS